MKINLSRYVFGIFILACGFVFSNAAYAAAPARVVSLKPSITDVVYALGLGEQLVGVSRYCEAPAGMKKPEVVADYTRPYTERIIALAPDLVLGSKENSSRRSIESLEGLGIRVELFPFTTLDETLNSIKGIAAALGEPARGEALAKKIASDLDALKKKWSGGERPHIVIVWGTKPVVVAGKGTYMDEMLGYIGAENAMQGDKWMKYPRIGLEDLIALNPDAIVDLSMSSEEKRSARDRGTG